MSPLQYFNSNGNANTNTKKDVVGRSSKDCPALFSLIAVSLVQKFETKVKRLNITIFERVGQSIRNGLNVTESLL